VTKRGAVPLTLRAEVARKALHMGWAVIPAMYAKGVPRNAIVGILIVATTGALVVELARRHSGAVRAVFHRAMGNLLREHEHNRMSGATWLLISFLIAVVLFDAPIAIGAMWAVAVGDASAALVGRSLGRIRIRHSRKTIEGSIACVTVTALGCFLVAGLSPVVSMIAGLIAAAAEWPIGPLDDNIRIGMMVGTGILLCHMAFS